MTLAKLTADAGHGLWASPKSAVYDLGEAMDALYGRGAWDHTDDAQPAATAALQALRARYGRGVLRLAGAARFRFASGLASADTAGHMIEGFGELASLIDLDFASGAFLPINGNSGYTGGGLKNVGFSLVAGKGLSTVRIVHSEGNATDQGSQVEIANIYASALGDSYYYGGGFFYGVARTSPQGIRVLNIRNWQQFRCHNQAFGFYNVVQGTVSNIGSYSGTATGNNIGIGGGGASNANTTQLSIEDMTCGGELNLTNAADVRLRGKAGSIAVGSSFDYYDVRMRCAAVSGTPGSNGHWEIF